VNVARSRTSRRRGGGDGVTIIYWRDIPAQVSVTNDGATDKAMLEPRFQHAIDRAAAVAGLTDDGDYVAQWRRVTTAIAPDDDGQALAARVAANLDADYPRDRLEQLVADGGTEEPGDPQ
jgi:hypothetical protein